MLRRRLLPLLDDRLTQPILGLPPTEAHHRLLAAALFAAAPPTSFGRWLITPSAGTLRAAASATTAATAATATAAATTATELSSRFLYLTRKIPDNPADLARPVASGMHDAERTYALGLCGCVAWGSGFIVRCMPREADAVQGA